MQLFKCSALLDVMHNAASEQVFFACGAKDRVATDLATSSANKNITIDTVWPPRMSA